MQNETYEYYYTEAMKALRGDKFIEDFIPYGELTVFQAEQAHFIIQAAFADVIQMIRTDGMAGDNNIIDAAKEGFAEEYATFIPPIDQDNLDTIPETYEEWEKQMLSWWNENEFDLDNPPSEVTWDAFEFIHSLVNIIRKRK